MINALSGLDQPTHSPGLGSLNAISVMKPSTLDNTCLT